MRGAVFLLCLLAVPMPVQGGAWLRQEGGKFFSGSLGDRRAGQVRGSELDLYFEYGWRSNATLGANLFLDGRAKGHLLGFLRLPLPIAADGYSMAAEVALGANYSASSFGPMARAGVSIGRGFPWGDGYGWANLDLLAELTPGNSIVKLDATLGQSSGARFRPMIKVGLSGMPGQVLSWYGSAHILTDTAGGNTLLAGIERKSAGGMSNAFSVALWRNF